MTNDGSNLMGRDEQIFIPAWLRPAAPSQRIGLSLFAFLCVLILVGCSPRVDPVAITRFEQAQKSFDAAKSKQDFLRVAAIYDQIIRSGIHSGAIFYNQGNAYMRAGQRGRAIASYRQAQRYRPRDPLLDANLRSALLGKGTTPRRPLIEYVLFWQNSTSYQAKFQANVIASVATFVIALVALLYPSTPWKRLATAALLVSLAITGSAVYDWYRFDYVQHGVVVVPETIARKGNAASYEPAFTGPLAEGTEFTVLEQRGDWLRAQISSGQEGWVRSVDVVEF